jgi:DNA modification methylase
MTGLQILTGDCREVLPTLEAESVQCCVTSPPYWGLRDYGIPPSIHGGDKTCRHEFIVLPAHNPVTPKDRQCKVCGKFGVTHWSKDKKTHTKCVECGAETEREDVESVGPSFCCPDFITDGDKPKNSKRIAEDQAVCTKCGAWKGVIGLEPTPELYIANMVAVFREVWRVLRDDGTCWINLGDSYAGSCTAEKSRQNDGLKWGDGGTPRGGDRNGMGKVPGLKSKDLCGIPWRLALAFQADGWYLRSDIIWHKPNPMPESVTDRPTKAHEYIFLLTKAERYFYDAEAIKEPSTDPESLDGIRQRFSGGIAQGNSELKTFGRTTAGLLKLNGQKYEMRNKRTVWTIPTQPYAEAHFATFPEDLVKPCILAGSKPGHTVLDPFAGSGTTGQVALELGRRAILIELNPKYVQMIQDRTSVTIGMF